MAQTSRISPRQLLLALALGTILVQFVLVSVTFPIGELLTPVPLLYVDTGFHWYQIEVARALADSAAIVGYDPFFGAGHLAGIHYNYSAKAPAALGVLLRPFASAAVAYKLYVFLAAVFVPVCIPLAAHWLRLPRSAMLASTVLGVLIWWLTAMRWYYTRGMSGHVVCSYLALPYAALAMRYLNKPGRWFDAIVLVATGGLGLFIHPLFAIAVAFALIPLAIAHQRELCAPRLLVVFVLVPVLAALSQLPWIIPTATTARSAWVTLTYFQIVDIAMVWNEALGRFVGEARGARLNAVLLFAAVWGCVAANDRRAKRIALALTFGSLALILFAALGGALPLLRNVQPNRFSSTAYLFLAIPAGVGVVSVIEQLSCRGLRRGVAAGSLAILMAAGTFLIGRELPRELSTGDHPHYGAAPPEVRGLGKKSQWMLGWLKTRTTPDARVLFEVHYGAVVFDYTEMTGYFAYNAGREFIGGPFPFMLFAGFDDGKLFGRPIESYSTDELARFFRMYNIGWIAVFSDASKRYLDRMPGVQPLESYDDVKTYAVDGPHSYFLEGSGVVTTREIGRIALDQLSGSSLVLKYHYVPGLRTLPEAKISPNPIEGNPMPFVRIDNPPQRLELRLP